MTVVKINVPDRTIFNHDNLEVLRGIDSGSVDLIYLDPPFNTKKQWHAPIGSTAAGASFKDIFYSEDVKDEWLETIKLENTPLHSFLLHTKADGISHNYAYLAYMSIRLIECHRVLKPSGSLYLHVDSTMSHYLKVVMDSIFGERNFVNEIIWKKYAGRKNNATRKFTTQNDSILFYAKSDSQKKFMPVFISHSEKEIRQEYKYVDEKGRRYRLVRGREYQRTGEQRKIYLKDSPGRAVGNLWVESDMQLNTSSAERIGYPTQKPLALLERIIRASSHEGDVVLDPFCGCATTCVAAERLNRNWIGVDISVKAYELIKQRLDKEVTRLEKILWDKEISFFTYPPKRTDQGLPENVDQGYIYVISHPILTPHYVEGKMTYKVGIAKNFERRLASYQTGSPGRAYAEEYKALTPNYKEIERALFDRFDSDRENEWVTADLKDLIAAIKGML